MARFSVVGSVFAAFNAVASVGAFALGDVGTGVFFAAGALGAFGLAAKGDPPLTSSPLPTPTTSPHSGFTL